MALNDALKVVVENVPQYGELEISHSEASPFGHAPTFSLACGLELRFDPLSQSLNEIKLKGLSKHTPVTFRTTAGAKTFQPKTLTTKAALDLFGPVRPGTYEHGEYTLNYSWIALSFAIPPEDWRADLYVGPHAQLPTAKAFFATRLSVFQRASTAAPAGTSVIRVQPHAGSVQLAPDRPLLGLGSSFQDLLCELGEPDFVASKYDESLVHNTDSGAMLAVDGRLACMDYIVSYRQLGLDFVLDGHEHAVRRVVLHTNLIGHYDFGIYNRALFAIELIDSDGLVRTIDSQMLWSQVAQLMNGEGTPFAVCRGSEEAAWSPSEYRAFLDRGLMYEIAPASHAIASLTVFRMVAE